MLTLARLRVSADACLDRKVAQHELRDNLGEKIILKEKHRNDALRVAINYKLRQIPKQRNAKGELLEILAVETKNPEQFETVFHVRTKGKDVDYSSLVAKLTADKDVKTNNLIVTVPDSSHPMIPVLDEYVLHPTTLAMFGKDHLFDKDIRRLVETGPFGNLVKLFPGTWLTTSADQLARIQEWNTCLFAAGNFLHGEATITTLELNDTEVNRQSIASELADSFAAEFTSITERANDVAPYLPKLMKDYEDILKRMEIASNALKLPIVITDEMEDCELALMVLQSKEEEANNG